MTQKVKRKLKTMFPEKNESLLDSVQGLCFAITIVVIIIFVVTHLVINFALTPKGIELENLSREKDFLLENNRELGQEIARIKSISIIKEITGETMSLDPDAGSLIIYISNESIVAGL
jgi:hypothetical protein